MPTENERGHLSCRRGQQEIPKRNVVLIVEYRTKKFCQKPSQTEPKSEEQAVKVTTFEKIARPTDDIARISKTKPTTSATLSALARLLSRPANIIRFTLFY
jgi:hypothetical protein